MSKNKNDKTVFSGSNSFALFGDSITTNNGGNTVNLFNTIEKTSERAILDKQIGTQSVNEKSEQSEQHDSKGGFKTKRGFRSLKINKDDIDAKSYSATIERQDSSASDRGCNDSGEEQSVITTKDKGTKHRTGRSKRKVQETEGGNELHEGSNASGETVIDFKKYKLREFDASNKLQNYVITGKPRKTKDDFLVEVIIDGFRYKVSPWSIRNGQYIQGLDSNFLVQKYKFVKR